MVIVLFGIVASLSLVWLLFKKNPAWLSNPAEFSPGAQLGMLEISEKVSGREFKPDVETEP